MPTIWRFVDQPVASPTVLLDMNDGATWKCLGGDFFKLPAPPLKRSIASNAMSDGGIVSSAAYDLRTLTFTLELTAATEAGREAQMDALKAQLAKPVNLLMFQSELSANPVFFRTLRSDEYDLDTQFIPTKVWRVECTVLAEPFAIGIRHDVTSGLVVTNDPASGTNKTVFDIAGVRGDSPAPAFVRVALSSGTTPTFFWAQRTANNPTSLTVFAQAEAGTLGTDTTVGGHDSATSGSGVNPYVNPTFEVNASNWTVNNCTLTRDTSFFNSGVASGRLNSNTAVASGARFVNSIPITDVAQGVSYTASAWVRQGTTFTGGRVQIGWFNSSGTFLSVTSGASVTLSTTWQQATATGSPPAGAVSADVRVVFDPDPGTTAASAYFDDVARTPGGNFARTSFTTATLVTRLTVTVPTATDAAALRGRYRMLAKIRMSATGSNFTMRYVQYPGLANNTSGQQISFDSTAAITTVDLGIVEFGGPGPAPATIGYSGLSAAYTTQQLQVQIGRNSGTATLDMDYIYLLPADERSAQFARANWAASSYMVIDSPQELAYGMAPSTTAFGATRTVDSAGGLASYFGGWPMLVPGTTNRWYTLIGPNAATSTSTWDISYWPRWREVATS